MKILVSLSLLIFSINVYSFIPKLVTKKINNYKVEISINCKQKCHASEAVEKLTKEHIQKVRPYVFGGKAVGDVICRKIFKAKVKYYKDNKKNEQHFCLFKDGSYIPVGEFDYIESELAAKK